MRKFVVAFSLAVVPLFLGVFLPYVAFPGNRRFVNLFWGGIYGAAAWALGRLVDLREFPALALLWLVAWPIAVSCGLFALGWKFQHISRNRIRATVLCLIALSIFATIGMEEALRPPFASVPTFYRLFFAIW